VSAIFCQLIGPIVSANDRGNMGYGLIMLIRSSAKVASRQRGFDQIDWVRELAIKVQEYRPGMGLQRPHHLHRISRSVVKGVEDARQETPGRVVGVGAIAGSGNALEFGDEVAGTAVDRLASERAGQTSIRRVDQVDGRIARWQRSAGVDFTSDGKFGTSPAPQLNMNGIAASPSSQNKMDFVERFILGFLGLAFIATGWWTRPCLFLPNSSRRR
jgi:hypothetical protein